MELLIAFGLLAFGMFLLVKGAEFFLDGSVRLARHFGVSELIISLTLISIATTMPEITVSVISALKQESSLAVSNIVGTTMFNTCLLIGLVAYHRTIKIHQKVIDRDCMAMIIAYLLVMVAFGLGGITQILSMVLVVSYGIYLFYLYRHVKTEKLKKRKQKGLRKKICLMIIGLVGVYIGSNLAVNSAVVIASCLNINEWLIGAVILGGGTSLPELTVALHAVKKKKGVMAIGNVLGSNVIDILMGLGVASFFYPLVIELTKVGIDLCFGLIASVAVTLLAIEGEIDKNDSYFLLGLFFVYMVYLVSTTA